MTGKTRRFRIHEAVEALQTIADPALAQEWDNVGLLAGDAQAMCKGALLCVDMTSAVIDEAVSRRANLIVAYHPPLFRPVKRLLAAGRDSEAMVLRALQRGLNIHAMHTALDAAEGGTNDVLAGFCGLRDLEAFEDVPAEAAGMKIVVFVPPNEVDRVAEAMFAAGAGRIGQYEKCSFRLRGTGTFFGTEGTDPAVGQRGRLEQVDEVRLEAVVAPDAVSGVLDAIRRSHSYEEPAIDVYPLRPSRMRRGIGRIGALARPMTLAGLARRLARAVGASQVRLIGRGGMAVRRVAVCAGSAGRLLPYAGKLAACDALITGEVSHHDALYWSRYAPQGKPTFGAIALGHWHSERPVLSAVAQRLKAMLPALGVWVSDRDRDPFEAS